jgi:hypothetical protein
MSSSIGATKGRWGSIKSLITWGAHLHRPHQHASRLMPSTPSPGPASALVTDAWRAGLLLLLQASVGWRQDLGDQGPGPA